VHSEQKDRAKIGALTVH